MKRREKLLVVVALVLAGAGLTALLLSVRRAASVAAGVVNVVAGTVISLAGVALVWGAYKRWRWLVDPRVEAWPIYSQSFVKRFFGRNAVIWFTYFCGFLWLAIYCWSMWYEYLTGNGPK